MHARLEEANDEQLCRERREDTWVLADDVATRLEAQVANALPLVRHGGHEESRITSVYFDRVDGALSAIALASPSHCTKVRLRAYFSPKGALDGLFFEVKRREDLASSKWRLRLSPEAAGLLCEGRLDALTSLETQTLLASLGGLKALVPVVVVTYRRRVYQADATLRVTFDRGVTFHAPPASLEDPQRALAFDALAPAFGSVDGTVAELKHLGDVGEGLLAALAGGRHSQRFSKFVAALAARPGTGNVAQGS